jgi:hypothetical protein
MTRSFPHFRQALQTMRGLKFRVDVPISSGTAGRCPIPPSPSTLEELRQELHQANERYHALREAWEKWTQSNEFRHQERVDAAMNELRNAERAVEAIEEKILEAMRGERG